MLSSVQDRIKEIDLGVIKQEDAVSPSDESNEVVEETSFIDVDETNVSGIDQNNDMTENIGLLQVRVSPRSKVQSRPMI